MISDSQNKELRHKRRVIVILQASCVLLTAFYYMSITGAIYPMVISSVVLLLPVFKGLELSLTTRPLVYAFVMAMILSVIPFQLFRQNQQVFALLPATLLVPLLIISAAHLVWFEHKHWIVCSFCGLIFCCYLVGGDIIMGQSHYRTTSSINSYYLLLKLYYVCVICVLAMLLSIIRLQSRSRFTLMRKSYKYKFLQTFLLTSASVGCFYLAPKVQESSVPVLKSAERFFSSALQKMHHNSHKKQATNESDINQPFHHSGNQLGHIIMRVRGDNPPPMLRFYAYDHYESGVWKRDPAKVSSIKSEEGENTELMVTESYILNDSEFKENTLKTTVLPTGDLDPKIIPVSYDTSGLTLSVDSLDRLGDGALVGKNFSTATGVTLKRSGLHEDNFLSYPSKFPKEHNYLQVPENIRLYLTEKGSELFGMTNDAYMASSALVEYFANEYTYSLDYAGYDSEDPLMGFLESEQKSGHCELFATSTIMLLRSAGFPSRYATGAICVETSPNGEYMICRNLHLHAWVEVWDKNTQTWFVVDPTPGTSNALPNFEPEGLSAMMESLEYRFHIVISFILQGEIAEALGEFFFGLIEPFENFFKSTQNVVSTIVLVLLLFTWWLIRFLRAKSNKPKGFSDQFLKLQLIIGKLMQRMARHSDHIQGGSMTLSELQKQLCNYVGAERAEACCDIINSYQAWRFGAGPSDDSEVQKAYVELKSEIKELKL